MNSKEKDYDLAITIANDFGNYYTIDHGFVSNYENLRIKKKSEIEIHEKTLKIGYEISNNAYCSKILLYQTCFVDDILDYLIFISNGDYISGTKKDIIEYLEATKKFKNKDVLVKIIVNIVEISIIVIVNIINSNGDESRNFFLEKVI